LQPTLSLVVLTWNEEARIAACLASLARQKDPGLEVIVVDAASTDRTVATILELQPTLPFPLRLVVAETRIPIGEARNRGARLARADLVCFLSADAELADGWTAQVRRSLARNDLAYGRQVHAPERWTAAAAVRGLRYHFPRGFTGDPQRYASNVAAGYRREVLEAFPFDDWTDAAEDLLIARRAARAGYRVSYNPRMLVRHHDVTRARQEWRKNVREGLGWGLYASELGILWIVLAWALLLVAALATFAFGAAVGCTALAVALYLPALRRGLLGAHDLPWPLVVVGVAASPPYDLAFLATYLRGLAIRRRAPAGRASDSSPTPEETPA